MISALKVMKLTDVIPTLEIKHNTQMKTPERQMILLLLLIFGCMDASHPPQSAACDWFLEGYNMLYCLLRDATVDWRRTLSHVGRRGGTH